MRAVTGFDLYDERWRDCWLAATAAARLRRKQVDLNIHNRVANLLEDYGPQSEKPLTLRIYGTMIKGFCVLNNERSRSLFSDCERLVIMFARQPFAGADSAVRLPAAKRPRMEVALTLGLDLARIEASEAFDWTQAPLEEGALLRLGGGALVAPGWGEAQLLPPSQLLEHGTGLGFGEVSGAGGCGLEAGWLPRLDVGLGADAGPEAAAHAASGGDAAGAQAAPMDVESQLAVPNGEELEVPLGAPAAQWPAQARAEAAPGEAPAVGQVLAMAARRTRNLQPLIRPGSVYGFDDEPGLSPAEYERWQADDRELTLPRIRPRGYAEHLAALPEQQEYVGPGLRHLLDGPALGSPGFGLAAGSRGGLWAAGAGGGGGGGGGGGEVGGGEVPMGQWQPEEQLQQQPECMDIVMAPEVAAPLGVQAGVAGLAEAAVAAAAAGGGYHPDDDAGGFAWGGGAEAQDQRTAEVGEIIRNCLANSTADTISFHELIPPSRSDRTTAACTFSAILALACAGDLGVFQDAPYSSIIITASPAPPQACA